MTLEANRFVPAGFRCTECGRLDAQSNQPCTEHGDVEEVFRLVEVPALIKTGGQAAMAKGPTELMLGVLRELLETGEGEDAAVKNVDRMLGRDAGLAVTMRDGSVFYITVVQAKPAGN